MINKTQKIKRCKYVLFFMLACVVLGACSTDTYKPSPNYKVVSVSEGVQESFLRIHIRANSNNYADQVIKYLIKDYIIEYLTPYIANASSFSDVKSVLQSNLEVITQKTDKILIENGFNYVSRAIINNELFPTRKYGDTILPENYYDALIINLGDAVGDNWWCVVYPPLCFVGAEVTNGTSFVYKSKLVELINNFFK